MEQAERPPNGGECIDDASGSAWVDDIEETPPLPFPRRTPEYSRYTSHGERFPAATNESSAASGGDTWSCGVVLIALSFFAAMTLIIGVYAPETLQLSPNSSILIKPNHLFVDSIKVVELDGAKGSMLYGFYKIPPLDVSVSWSEIHKTSLPISTHKEWMYYLNEGSQINILYSMNSPSSTSLIFVIAEGKAEFANWLEDPLYSNANLSWKVIRGNGTIQKAVHKASAYYVAVGNLNSEPVKVQLDIRIQAFVFNTTEPYYKCIPAQSQCNFKLLFLGGNAALLTSPGREPGIVGGDFDVKISYGPRWNTYLVGIGGMAALVLVINYFLNHFRHTEPETRGVQAGSLESERSPLLLHKDEDLRSWGSSYASNSEDEEFVGDALAEGVGNEKLSKNGEYSTFQCFCAICFDAPSDCFFLPCGHCVACFGCATRISETSRICPICRRRIKKVRKIYSV